MRQSRAFRTYPQNRRVSEAAARIAVAYVEAGRFDAWLASSGANPLAVLSFNRPFPGTIPYPTVPLAISQLEGPPVLEVWSSDQPVNVKPLDGGFAAFSGDIMAGAIAVQETRSAGLETTTELAYRRMLALTQELGFPYLWRIWNFFPDINGETAGLERYRQFCIGRHRVLAESLPDFPASLPAGTAVGTQSGPLQLCFLAGTYPATNFGNPRQVNAYEYPKMYGPQSPSFARATLCRSEIGPHLFIAGTASVVGHASRHVGLPHEQIRETIENLRALLRHADDVTDGGFTGSRRRGLFKIYVRHPAHLSIITDALQGESFTSDQLLLLKGDLCRRELVVEIEGLVPSLASSDEARCGHAPASLL